MASKGSNTSKLLLGGSVLAGVMALAGILYWTQKSKSTSKSSSETESPISTSAKKPELEEEKGQSSEDEKLQARVQAALDVLRNRYGELQMDPTQLPKLIQKEDTDLLNELLSLDPSKYNKASRKAAVDFICCYYEFIHMGQNFAEFAKFTLNGESDAALSKAWDLLAVADDENEDEATMRSAVVAKLDVAQRLFDSDRLVSLYHQINQEDVENLTAEELVSLFGVAPVLGQYQTFRKLGTLLRERDHEGFLSFHSESLHRETLPSYFLAFFQSLESIPEDYTFASIAEKPLECVIGQFESIMNIESDVRSPNPEIAEQVKAALKQSTKEGEWMVLPNPIPLLLFGGLASSRSIDDYSPLCGFVTRDGKKIKMMGFRPEFQIGMQSVQFVELIKDEEAPSTTNDKGQVVSEWFMNLQSAQYMLREPEVFVPQITGSKAPCILRAMQKLKVKITTLGTKSTKSSSS